MPGIYLNNNLDLDWPRMQLAGEGGGGFMPTSIWAQKIFLTIRLPPHANAPPLTKTSLRQIDEQAEPESIQSTGNASRLFLIDRRLGGGSLCCGYPYRRLWSASRYGNYYMHTGTYLLDMVYPPPPSLESTIDAAIKFGYKPHGSAAVKGDGAISRQEKELRRQR